MTEPTKYLDVTGMACPSPLIQLRTAVDSISNGDMLEIRGDDPVFEATVRDFCEETGHTLLCVESAGRVITMRLEKQDQK